MFPWQSYSDQSLSGVDPHCEFSTANSAQLAARFNSLPSYFFIFLFSSLQIAFVSFRNVRGFMAGGPSFAFSAKGGLAMLSAPAMPKAKRHSESSSPLSATD